ncbi:hypothetical protein [Streptococcus salivarius]|uniref:hypothetical protein n=1 Tax=Streptococcus salivarius TaxID=1304 RepID=UPI0012BC4937|nr:hypothetical protein [Streptococcus salivarius]MTQ57701.1 hypothetical protein [Streptococcus salivarius]MTQ59421.1 hypothetical protein [Streptococcus salivarius]MTQ65352.1 hypothetical protein [Streptococcus salivarius]MTQ65696.1 hypothetical protein [Streptococcus salivarius]MTQ70630.1 hypothetical protein [Streptococcus salivarius]
MTKAKKWKIAIIVLLGLVATVLIAIGEGRFWKYQRNYIPDGTYQMIKYEDKSAYSNELINRTERGENNDSLYEDFIVVENMKSQFYYVFVGDGESFVSPFEHDEKLPQTFDPRTGTLKQDLTPSEYGNKVHSNLQKFNKDGGQFRKWREISTSECVEDYKRMLKRKRTYEKRPKGFAINVYDTNGNISSRRVFERLSSSEAEDLHLDYEGAYKFVKESRFDWQTESDFLIWR